MAMPFPLIKRQARICLKCKLYTDRRQQPERQLAFSARLKLDQRRAPASCAIVVTIVHEMKSHARPTELALDQIMAQVGLTLGRAPHLVHYLLCDCESLSGPAARARKGEEGERNDDEKATIRITKATRCARIRDRQTPAYWSASEWPQARGIAQQVRAHKNAGPGRQFAAACPPHVTAAN